MDVLNRKIQQGLKKVEELIINCDLQEAWLYLNHTGEFQAFDSPQAFPSKSNAMYWLIQRADLISRPSVPRYDVLKSLGVPRSFVN